VYAGRDAHARGGSRDMPPVAPGRRDRQRPSAAGRPRCPNRGARVRARA